MVRSYFIGSTWLLTKCADQLLAQGEQVMGVVSADPHVIQWAEQHAIPHLPDVEALAKAMQQQPPDYLFSIINHHVLPQLLIDLSQQGVINFHDGNLPRYAGSYIASWVILEGATDHAVTWHWVTSRVDAGDIICQQPVPYTTADNALSLSYHNMEVGLSLFKSQIAPHLEKELPRQPQNAHERRFYARKKRPSSNAVLDFHDDATKLARLARALDFGHLPNPLTLPKIATARGPLIVRRITDHRAPYDETPGYITELNRDNLAVACAKGWVKLHDFMTLDGQPLTPQAALTIIGADVGDVMPMLTLDEKQRIDALQNQLASFELAWRRQLLNLKPLQTLPAPSNLPATRYELHGVHHEHAAAAFIHLATAVARITGRSEFTVAFTSSAIQQTADETHKLCETHIPLRFQAEVTSAETLEKQLNQPLFLRDLWARLGKDVREAYQQYRKITFAVTEDAYANLADETCLQLTYNPTTQQISAWVRDEMLPTSLWQKLMAEFDATTAPPASDNDTTALAMITAQCQRTPNAIAVQCGTNILDYATLDRWSDQLAWQLNEHNVTVGDRVGLMLPRSINMVVGMLAIFKAGGVLVPMDTSHPRERLRHYAEAADCRLILTAAESAAQASMLDRPILTLGMHTPPSDTTDRPLPTTQADDLAYIIFTSGSTGLPKGVAVEHAALGNFLTAMQEKPGIQAKDKLLAVTTITFDISLLELLLPLTVGATIIVATEDDLATGDALKQCIAATTPTIMQATPTTWHILLRAGWQPPANFRVLCGGEAISHQLAAQLLAQGVTLWNMYGPTEATIWTSVHQITSADTYIPIGEPLPNTKLLVLNEELEVVAAEQEGDLYIAGHGLARGYFGLPELTTAVFLTHPITSERIYYTGDRVYLHTNGDIEWRGRSDFQVKIRGYRIEIGEVENALEEIPMVTQAVVIAQRSQEDVGAPARLVAYLIANAPLQRQVIVDALSQRLPDYMMPSVFVQVDNFPTTLNNKVDRRALPKPSRDNILVNTPSQSLQDKIKAAFEHILDVQGISADDDFFQLGGESLLVGELASYLSGKIGQRVPASLVFARPTPHRLAQALGALPAATPPVQPVETVVSPVEASETNAPPQPVDTLASRIEVSETGASSAVEISPDALAIVGVACRFPGADTPDQFWENLRGHRNHITPMPASRRAWFDYWQSRSGGNFKAALRAQGWLSHIEKFDYAYFGISKREARRMDPLQRLMLTVASEAVQSAGYHRDDLSGKSVGVFVGSIAPEYASLLAEAGELQDAHAGTGTAVSLIPNRISYYFNWSGPSLAVDTACSSSLVAIDIAAKQMQAGIINWALIGGVNAILCPHKTLAFAGAGMLSPDNQCQTFDDRANGYVRGEGCGAILVRRFADAQAAGDPILAIIRGSTVNHDGGTKGFLTAPNVLAQQTMLQQAWHDAGIEPATLDYIEAHGTGTALGDPIEIDALTQAFAGQQLGSCGIGSVKSNIGHLEAAAGIAGVIKCVMALQSAEMPPSLHIDHPNRHILFEETPFHVVDRVTRWERQNSPRRAGISSFGFGGANAHIVLEETPAQPVVADEQPGLLILSARSWEGMHALIGRYRKLIDTHRDLSLTALCASARRADQNGTVRVAIIVASLSQLVDKLTLLLNLPPERHDEIRDVYSAMSVTPLERPLDKQPATLELLAQAYTAGYTIDWSSFIPHRPTRVRVPSTPFEEEVCWVDPPGYASLPPSTPIGAPLLSFDANHHLIRHHQVAGDGVLPGMSLLSLAATQVNPTQQRLQRLSWVRAAMVTDKQPITLRVVQEEQQLRIEADGSGEDLYFQCELGETAGLANKPVPTMPAQAQVASRTDLYQAFDQAGLAYGPLLQTVKELYLTDNEVFGTLQQVKPLDPPLQMPDPCLLDGALQCVLALSLLRTESTPHLYVPFFIDEVHIHRTLPTAVNVYGHIRTPLKGDETNIHADITLFDQEGVILELRGVVWKRLRRFASPTVTATMPQPTAVVPPTIPQPRRGDISDILIDKLAALLEVNVDEIDPQAPLVEQGVDSLLAVNFAQMLQETFSADIPPTIALEVAHLAELADELVNHYHVKTAAAVLPPSEVLASQHNVKTAVPPTPPPPITTGPTRYAAVSTPEPALDDPTLNNSIAIIGLDGIFPQANSPDELWENLVAGRDCITTVPAKRWDMETYYDEDPNKMGGIYARWGGFAEDIYNFDPQLFHISPKEAPWLDPQQRQLLQLIYRALEQACLAGGQLRNTSTGVFVAASYNHYRDQVVKEVVHPSAGLGNHNAILANRISYHFSLTGPCLTVDTLCSSSLVALHMAIESLRRGESQYAIVAGAHLDMSPQYYQMGCRLRSFSPRGRCRTFDAGADGFVPGEGVGVLILQPLAAAMAENRPLAGILLGSAVNHGGTASGLTVPNSTAQRMVVEMALENAGVSSETISYVEAHGTGTSLGDPIEIDGLTAAYRRDTAKRQFCAIGSLKTNIGHLEPAAGIASVIKVLLAFRQQQLPPTIHLTEVNQRINFEDSPFYIVDHLSAWQPANGTPRRAGISAFGMGGVNAHVIVQEPPARPQPSRSTRPVTIMRLSGIDEAAVRRYADRMADYLEQPPADQHLADIAYAANVGRGDYRYRTAVAASDTTAMQTALRAVADGKNAVGRRHSKRPKVAFLFTGQGSQMVGMGRTLYENEPLFHTTLGQCADLLKGVMDVPLYDVLFNSSPQLINQTQYAQPALFTIEVALARLLQSWGIMPDVLLGHSIGEYAAAVVSNIFSLEDALHLVVQRGRLMQAQPAGGGMAVLRASADTVQAKLAAHPHFQLDIAAYNSPLSTVLSGSLTQLQPFCELSELPYTMLEVSHAFHSALMEPVLLPFRHMVEQVSRGIPQIPILSNLTGDLHTIESAQDPHTWAEHVRQPVRFADNIRRAWHMGARVFWEIGPRAVLTTLGKQVLDEKDVLWLPSLKPKKEYETLWQSVADYYAIGGEVNWQAMEALPGARPVPIPTYPFAKEAYNAKTPMTPRVVKAPEHGTNGLSLHPLFGGT